VFNLEDFLSDPSTDKTILLSLNFRNPSNGDNVPLFLSNRHYYGIPNRYGVTDRVEWKALILPGVSVETDGSRITNGGITGGVIRNSFSGFNLDNSNDELTEFFNYDLVRGYWYIGSGREPIENFFEKRIWTGRFYSNGNRDAVFEISDELSRLEKRFCKFRETNATWETFNHPRVEAYGSIQHFTPVLDEINGSVHRYRLDQTFAGANGSSSVYVDGRLTTHTIHPSGNFIFIDGDPEGTVSVVYWGRSLTNTAATTAQGVFLNMGEIVEDVCSRFSVTVDPTDIASHIAMRPQTVQLVERSDREAVTVINDFIASSFSYLWDNGETVRFRSLYDPDGPEPVDLHITDNNIFQDYGVRVDTTIQPVSSIDALHAIPQSTSQIRSEIASWNSYFTAGGRRMFFEDSSVETDYQNSKNLSVSYPTVTNNGADMYINHAFPLISKKRILYDIRVDIGLFQIGFLDKIHVRSKFAGLSNGKNLIVLRVKYLLDQNIVEITGWG